MSENELDRANTKTGDLTGFQIGRFVVSSKLGSGGMGEVYRAEDTQLQRTVAIKRLSPQSEVGGHRAAELLKEAQKASSLNHPRIAGVYDVFTEGNELFLVMEYIDGVTLRERLESPLAVNEFCGIALQCVEAMSAAHAKGILHGDLKPANIMVTRQGDVKICDFGLSRRVAVSAGAMAETASTTRAAFAGTPAYMAPEAVVDDPLDLRADIFSLGVVFYESLSGRNPFWNQNLIKTMDQVRHLTPQPLDEINPNVPSSLSRLIQRMMEKDPADRYGSISGVWQDLAAIQTELSQTGSTPAPRRRRLWAARVSLAVALIGIAIFYVHKSANKVSENLLPVNVTLAVLPFPAAGGDSIKTFFSDGLAEALASQLSRLTEKRNFQVVAFNDIRARNVKTARDAREQVGANLVLEGTLQYSGASVHITCDLLDTASGQTLKKETISAAASDVLDVEQHVAEAVIRMLGLTLSGEEWARFRLNETSRPGAYDYYLQARGYLLNFDRLENLDTAITVFREALQVDPRYALAYAGLGEAYWRKYELTGASVWLEPARGACEGALAIDPAVAEPHACLGMVLNGTGDYEKASAQYAIAISREPTNDSFYTGLATAYEKMRRPADAEQTYRRAIALQPHYWAAYDRLGSFYYRLSKYDDSIAMFRQVVALAPDNFRGYSSLGAAYFMKDETPHAIAAFEKSLAIKNNLAAASNLGTLYFFENEYERAAEAFRKAVSIDQGRYQAWSNLGAALEWTGKDDEARAAFKRARDLTEEQIRVNSRDVSLRLALAFDNAGMGDMDKAQESFRDALRLSPADSHTLFQIADFYEFRLHHRDDALAWLSRAVDRGQTWREIDRSPDLAELRKDPRFQQLRNKQNQHN